MRPLICRLYTKHSDSMPGLQGPLLLSAGTPSSTQPPGSLTQSTRWAHTDALVQCHPLAIAFIYAFVSLPTLLGRPLTL